MAALRLCPSGGLVVSASQLSFSTLSPRILQPFGRRDNASLLSLKTSMGRMGRGGLRHRHAIGAQKGTVEGPDPDDKKRADMPFREDIEKIDEYDKAMASWNTSMFHIEATTFSMYLCMIAKKGVKLASRVMDSAALRLDKQDEISSCTTKQTLAMGVAAVGHILLQDAMANVNYVGYSYSLVLDVDDTWREFGQKMNNLEEKFRAVSKSAKAYEILRPTMTDAMILTIFFISAVVARHERVLGYAPGLSAGTKGRRSINASDDGEPGASGTALQE